MKTMLLTLLFLTASFSVQANHFAVEDGFCEWLGNASNAIAQNRDRSMSETDMISNYLKQAHPYERQLIIIPLIDWVYSIEKYLTPDETAFVERRQCVIGMIG